MKIPKSEQNLDNELKAARGTRIGVSRSEMKWTGYEAECHFNLSDSLLVSSYGPGELSYTLREPPAGLLDPSGPILSLLQKIHYSSPIKKKRVYIFKPS